MGILLLRKPAVAGGIFTILTENDRVFPAGTSHRFYSFFITQNIVSNYENNVCSLDYCLLFNNNKFSQKNFGKM